MHAEIVVTGTELLLGEIVDTNSTLMARMLRDIGLTPEDVERVDALPFTVFAQW